MSSAAGVRAGKAFVEVGAYVEPFMRKMRELRGKAATFGNSLADPSARGRVQGVGAGLMTGGMKALGGGLALGAPMLMGVKAAANFQDSLLELKAATASLSPEQYDKVRAAALRMSKELKVGPADAAKAITLLVKAGMPMEEALGGAGKAAIEFAKVAGVDVAQAAEFMKVSMNVFGISAQEASNTLSAAADASETNIAQMVEAFPQIASVAKGTGQSLFGLAQAIAVLARYGMTGEEAGTGIKTVLTKLIAPTNEAKTALASMGLSMESFVDASGKLLPISQIAAVFEKKLRGMSKSAREAMLANEALVNVFDVRGIKVIQAFADAGEKTFSDIATEMENARTVAEKYAIMMEGLTGFFAGLYAATMRLADAFGTALAPSLRVVGPLMGFLIDSATWLLANVPLLSTALATTAATLTVMGGGMMLVGGGVSLIARSLGAIIQYGPMVVAVCAKIGAAFTALIPIARSLMASMGPIGLALTAASIAIPAATWLMGGGEGEAQAQEVQLARDEEKQSLAEAGGGKVGPGKERRKHGETIATFGGGALGQLGIGASINADDQTAQNTARMTELLEDIRENTAKATETAKETVNQATPKTANGVGAVSERGLLSAAERTAIGVERTNEILRAIAMQKGQPLVFA
jgi:TP901 family phage tail tape measure protein